MRLAQTYYGSNCFIHHSHCRQAWHSPTHELISDSRTDDDEKIKMNIRVHINLQPSAFRETSLDREKSQQTNWMRKLNFQFFIKASRVMWFR